MIIAVPKLKLDCFKRMLYCETIPSTVYPKIVPRYVKEFRESVIERGFADGAWNCLQMIRLDSRAISLMVGQRAFVREAAVRGHEV